MKTLAPNTLFCGQKRVHYTSIDSTNLEAQRLNKSEKQPEGLLITADEQESGKGYGQNVWKSEPEKNILMTILLNPVFLKARFQFYLNQSICLAIHDTLGNFLDKDLLEIKWPNDIVYNGKKLCGVLIENSLQGNFIHHAYIGIGINVNQKKFSSALKNATSLSKIKNKLFDTEKIIMLLCENIEARYLQLKANNIQEIQKDYMQKLFQLEEQCNYKIAGKELKGKITGINPEGKLVIDTADGYMICGYKEVEFL
ncbi:MAG: biotin--[acetyl-CoA-carboxylase] ligase [Ignavibacteria bacterium]|nr:biotin--[acetyl-CoA-carboxylase] ligase [Ignavibacteria bacterium]